MVSFQNGKKYIGISCEGMEARKKRHLRSAIKSSCIFHKALIKYQNEEIKWEIIDIADSWDTACILEKKYIEQYNSYNDGYNMTLGGDGSYGFTHSEQSKSLMSKAKKGKPQHQNTIISVRKRMQNTEGLFKGKKHSEESKIKASNACKEAWTSTELKQIIKDIHSIPVECYNKDGIKIKEFNSITEAYSWLDKKVTGGIAACCRGEKYRKTAYGYIWKYKEVTP